MVDSIRYIRKLTALLVISGSLNIILIVLIFYWILGERPPTPYFELKPANRQEQQAPLALDHSDSEVIRYFRRMPMQWLISRLNNKQLVENGYTQRDLALASLVAFHGFDLDRAFSGLSKPIQKRLIVYGKYNDGRPAELVVYPEMSEKHFEAIRSFAATERWPLTSRGLFLTLQKEENIEDDSHLLDTFFMTSEFSTVEMLFSRNEHPVTKEELLKVILEGNWDRLSDFVEQQKKSHDLSQARRQHFLLEYARNKSKAAAQLMLKTDGTFAVRKLDDKQVLMLLQLIEEKSPQAELFASTLLKSPRSDAVRKLAAERLYEYGGTASPETYLPQPARHASSLTATAPIAASLDRPLGNSKEKVKPDPEVKAGSPTGKLPQTITVSSSASSNGQKPFAQQSDSPKPVPKKTLATSAPKSKDFYYVVQEGDSLWKIGRRFGVDIEVLRAFNQLKTDALYPGMKLRIPLRG